MAEPHCDLCVLGGAATTPGVPGVPGHGALHVSLPPPPADTLAAQGPTGGGTGTGPLGWLLDTSDFPARWHCGTWDSWLGWMHITSDTAIWLAYMAIPAALLLLVMRRRDLPFGFLLVMFAVFILSCGTTHLIEASIFWNPVYRLSGFAKAGTALVSLATVGLLLPALPKLLAMPGRALLAESLEEEVRRRQVVEAELRESEQRLELVLQAANLGWWDYSPGDDDMKRSPHWYKMLGYDPGEVTVNMREARNFLHPDDVDEQMRKVAAALESEDGWYSAQFRIRHARGHYFWMSSQGRVVERNPDGSAKRMLGVNIDIDRLQTTEQSLVDRTRELEDMMRALSRDIQTPLVTIQGFLKYVREAITENRPDEALADLDRVDAGTEQLKEVVGDILEVSTAGHIGTVHRLGDPMRIFGRVVDQLAPLIAERGAKVEVAGTLPEVCADPAGLERVLRELLENALRHGCPQPGMTVRVHGAQTSADTFFSVSDDGPGIAPDRQRQVFRMFEREPSEGPRQGMGLAAVGRIMASHHGRVWVESNGRKGSTFCVAFPKPLDDEAPD